MYPLPHPVYRAGKQQAGLQAMLQDWVRQIALRGIQMHGENGF